MADTFKPCVSVSGRRALRSSCHRVGLYSNTEDLSDVQRDLGLVRCRHTESISSPLSFGGRGGGRGGGRRRGRSGGGGPITLTERNARLGVRLGFEHTVYASNGCRLAEDSRERVASRRVSCHATKHQSKWKGLDLIWNVQHLAPRWRYRKLNSYSDRYDTI